VLWGRPHREIQLLAAVWLLGTIALLDATFPLPDELHISRIFFWVVITAAAVALPVRLPGGVAVNMSTAPLLAAAFDSTLPQPLAVCWVALIGTIEPRDLRRQIPWYGSVFNKFNYVLAGYAAWLAVSATTPVVRGDPLLIVLQIAVVGAVFMLVNNTLSVLVASARTSAPVRRVFTVSLRNVGVGLVSQVPLGWLMAEIANKVGEWATLLFIVPLLLARYSFTKYTEVRDLFYGSVSALSQAIDAKDGFTRGHADRVSRIAGAIAREIGLPERQIEQIELAAMLHDIGKIGVEDRILMKPSRLDPEETQAMRRHSQYGASILEPSASLRPLVPMVLHHHESYDGSGYPDGLKAEAIPLGSRVIIVADAYEAMTSDRIYRKAMGHERAMEQLQKYKGVQFDPRMVRAIDQLLQKRGPGAFEVSDLPPIEYETLAELRRRLAQEPPSRDAHAG
jgi:HD-GYP domain-containing protein (c-di-GMP phosphodiesterase class II)